MECVAANTIAACGRTELSSTDSVVLSVKATLFRDDELRDDEFPLKYSRAIWRNVVEMIRRSSDTTKEYSRA